MGRYSYIRQQIEQFRASLKTVKAKSRLSPEDAGLRELEQIFTNRITSLEMLAADDDSKESSLGECDEFHNAA